jgi:hypothetical protein
MRRLVLAVVGMVACTDDGPLPAASLSSDAGLLDAAALGAVHDAGGAGMDAALLDADVTTTTTHDGSLSLERLPDGCSAANVPPLTLDCTGLYADFASKTLSQTLRAYAPAVPLWSDGAEKKRWIVLPPGQQIDVENPNEWIFPIGTKLFKEFSYQGKRVETRLFQKTAQNFWVHATYAWNSAETEAPISYGGSVPVDADGGTWVIPTPENCDQCHRGRSDRILGFEQVSLGLTGATGMTLSQLATEGLLRPAPTRVDLRVGDDGTGQAAPALSWLHTNCGVSCHNVNANSSGYGAKMDLRLDATLLDGAPASSAWGPLKSTLGVKCVSGSVAGQPRILPGVVASSAIVQLITQRGVLQMPPIATRVVDTQNVALLARWIEALPSSADAGVADADVTDAGAEPADASAEPADASAEPADASAEPADASAEPADASAEPADVGDPAADAAATAQSASMP